MTCGSVRKCDDTALLSSRVVFRFGFNVNVHNMFTFQRKQFPLHPTFAGTAHRFQGDTILGSLCVDVREQSFAHGQLSVAISRGTKCSSVTILGDENVRRTRRVRGLVYRKLLGTRAIKIS